MTPSFFVRLLLWLGLLVSPLAQAGRSCEAEHPPQAQTVVRGLNLAERTQAALDASGQRVVLLARAGQDLSKYNIYYSHFGFAYQQPQVTADGKSGHVWRVMHKLNQCGTADAFVYRQGLGEFFLDDLWRYEAAWVVPTREVQERLLPLLLDSGESSRALILNASPTASSATPGAANTSNPTSGPSRRWRWRWSRRSKPASRPRPGCSSMLTSPPRCTLAR